MYVVTFASLPQNTTLKIYTILGEFVFEKNEFVDNYRWDLKNNEGKKVASGIYIYLLEDGQDKKVGKLGVIR